MKNGRILFAAFCLLLGLSQCKPNENETKEEVSDKKPAWELLGYQSLPEYGKHLVTIGGCHDCHTPKKMGPNGPELDMELALSGHPAAMPYPDVDRAAMEAKGYAVTQTLTAWVGPWGVSYASNLTSDPTGLGGWTEEQFFRALREGKNKGNPNGRTILPPMPWQMFQAMRDDEIQAIFAYLQTTKPIDNVVPDALPPSAVGK
jgi:mono/diheme cytochrome c family protein